MMQKRRIGSNFFIFFLAGIIILLLAAVSYAQGSAYDIHIYKVDFSGFPTIAIYSAPLSGNGVVADLAKDDFRVYEDGKQRDIQKVDLKYVGSQIAVVYDISGSFKLDGLTAGKKRYQEAEEAILELVNPDNGWLNQGDKVMLIAPTSRDDFDVVQDWTGGYTAIYNMATQLTPVDGDTPLLSMLQDALKRMKDVPDFQERAKFLLVFSDGKDAISPNEVTDVLNRAEQLGVTILTVKMGPANAGNPKNLQRLAQVSNGVYTVYGGPESLQPLYSVIKSQGYQYVVSYRSRITNKGDHSVQLGVVHDGREDKSQAINKSFSPGSFEIELYNAANMQPLNGQEIDRVTDDWQMPLEKIPPTSIQVRLRVNFPDNRSIEKASFMENGAVLSEFTGEEIKKNDFIWDLSKLPEGESKLTINVIVRDSLGMESDSGPVNVTVRVHRPPMPTNSSIAGQIPGGAGEKLTLVDAASGEPIAKAVADDDGNYIFSNIKPGSYKIINDSRSQGQTEIGPFEVDGKNALQVPEDQEFSAPPIVDTTVARNPLFWVPWAIALLALGFSIFVFIKRPQVVMGGLAAVGNVVQEMTQPFRPQRGMQHMASASLVPIIDDAGTRGNPIPLPGQSVFVGRDPARAQITFADSTVSRLHARIVEESDGVFMLYDEGSSSGTYVNEVQVGHEPVRLNAGDLIEFGRVKTIFVPESDAEVTEPFLGR